MSKGSVDKTTKRRSPFRNYRKKQRNTSVFFLIWSIFTALSIVLCLTLGIGQQFLFSSTYKKEAFSEVSDKGRIIEMEIMSNKMPEGFGGNFSGYLRYLSKTHEVSVFLLNEEGDVLFPKDHNVQPELQFNFSEVLKQMKAEMERTETSTVVFEGEEEYIYGSKIAPIGESEVYLYVGRSLHLLRATMEKLGVRMTLMSVFVVIMAFVVSSAVSAWLTKPITEMTEKAKRLAKGDFDVDFYGADYGQEMVQLADTLNYTKDELKKTDDMQKELIANVSHDFKTPLTMIKAYASMIQEISGDIPEKRNKHAQVIIEETDRLTSLVNDVLDLSKMRSNVEALKECVFNMSSYVYEIMDRFTYLKETQGYTFVVDVDERLYTKADKMKIGQVLYNLIGNAVNYTGEDKKVYVRLKKQTNESFRFEVRDTGVGIKSEELSAVWERYYRSSETHKRPVKGMGLGLSIVKTILEKHAFSFGVESIEGEGSTFYVNFPLIEKEEINA